MKAHMITMVGREESAARTAGEFEEHGIEVVKYVQPESWPVGRKGNSMNSKRVIEAAMVDGEDFLFIEDDLFLKHDRFDRALRDVREHSELTYLYIHESTYWMKGIYPSEDSDGPMSVLHRLFNFRRSDWTELAGDVVIREGLRRLGHHQVFGSQCVFVPARHLPVIFDEHVRRHEYSSKVFSQNEEAFDTTLTKVVPKYRIPTFTWLPHPVQHTQNRINRTHRRSDVYSRSFHATSDFEAAESGVPVE